MHLLTKMILQCVYVIPSAFDRSYFLDIGTGSFVDTNYSVHLVIVPDQTKETDDFDGGRVFFPATDPRW